MNKHELDERVVELETRIAFQEDTLGKLDEALVHQQKEIERLTRQLAVLLEQVEQLMPRTEPKDEPPPPHY